MTKLVSLPSATTLQNCAVSLRHTPHVQNFSVRQLFWLSLLTIPSALGASSSPANALPPEVTWRDTSGLHPADWLVVGLYLAVVLGMGWYYSRQQTDEGEFFTAARRHMHPLITGISLYATLMSTITYLGKPGEVINKGPFLLVGQLIAAPLCYVIVGWLIVPQMMKIRVTSAYDLLESKLGLSIRLLGSMLFIALRLVWMSMLIYLSSVALVAVIGLDQDQTFIVTALAATVAIAYSSLGGLRTVVTTDVLQFILLFLGAVVTILIITHDVGGLSWIPREWSPMWDRQPWFSFDPTVRVTVFNVVVGIMVWRIATACSDQTAFQRYMAVKDVAAARRSYLTTELATIAVTILLGLLGFALLGFFTRYPGALGPGMSIKNDGDILFPYFIGRYLPIGLTGIVVSGVLAAAMSSIDSGVNAISAVVTKDILPRLSLEPRTGAGSVRLARGMTVAIGATIIGLSFLMQYVPGNFLEMVNRSGNLLVQPIFCLFVLALWIPFATPLGAWLGFLSGLGTAVLVAFWTNLTGQTGPSYHWIGLAALVADLAVGITVSRFGPSRSQKRASMVFGAVGATLLVVLFVAIVALGRASI